MTGEARRAGFDIYTGSYPPEVCGVGDYAQLLAKALAEMGCSVRVLKSGWRSTFSLGPARLTRSEPARILNIQYPTSGYGTSLLPHLACALARLVGIPNPA